MPISNQETTAVGTGHFSNTHWSVVLLAGQTPSPQVQEALEKLCRTYWYPLYAYVRRQGHGVADAEDLTQEFFSRLLGKNYLASVHPAKGKFRSFLLASLKHFLANEWDRVKAEKRGGRHVFISLDDHTAEDRYSLEPASEANPEIVFEKRWALTVLDQALAQLKDHYTAAGKAGQFEELRKFLSSEATEGAYDPIAARLQMAPGAVAVAVHRLRQHYGELLRAEIAQTVSTPAEIDEEMRHLFNVINQ